MLPAVWPGDKITVRRCPTDQLRPGQNALFHRDGKLTAHRILSLTSDGILTRGDSIDCLDPLVRPEEIVGRVESIRRDGRIVNLDRKLWQRAAAWMLRRSSLCMKATLYLARRLRTNWDMQPPQFSASPLASAE